jgi:hypothetical protein
MKFNFSLEKTDVRTNEIVVSDIIVTHDWTEIEEYWERNDVGNYEDIDNLVSDLNKNGRYDMYCNTDMITGDGVSVRIKASAEDKVRTIYPFKHKL